MPNQISTSLARQGACCVPLKEIDDLAATVPTRASGRTRRCYKMAVHSTRRGPQPPPGACAELLLPSTSRRAVVPHRATAGAVHPSPGRHRRLPRRGHGARPPRRRFGPPLRRGGGRQ
ncbi:hypothetical protein SEVIR_6G166350v4 [Setaria viridis]